MAGSRDEGGHAWGLFPPLPEDLPARAVCVLRECHLHVGGPLVRADPQDLRERKVGCLGWGVPLGFQHFPHPLRGAGGRNRLHVSAHPLDCMPHSALRCGANSLPSACGPEGGGHQHSNSEARGPRLESEPPVEIVTLLPAEQGPDLTFLICQMGIGLALKAEC